MQGFFPNTPELREYVAECVRAAPPSAARTDALAALGDATFDDPWALTGVPIDWAEIEYEAARQRCTVADVVFDRAGRHPSSD